MDEQQNSNTDPASVISRLPQQRLHSLRTGTAVITNHVPAVNQFVSSTNSPKEATAAGQYTIRPYEPQDRPGFLRLDSRVWDRTRNSAWFDWKYTDNPYVDHIPIIVAEFDDEIVGARPFLAFSLRVGEQSVVAYQPADTMVDPAHRRAGVFSRMTDQALSVYRDHGPELFFNFPNQHARPGYLKLGWRETKPAVTYYRVESPAAVATKSSIQQAAGALETVLSGYYAGRRRLSTKPTGLSVRITDGPAIDQLVRLHRRCRPTAIHADRTAAFLRWRLGSPLWDRQTHIVESATREEPLAALVARSRRTDDGLRLTQVVDVAPLCGRQRWREALWAGLDSVISSTPETDLFAISDGAIPHDVAATFGFLRDDLPPLSRLTTYDSMLVTRPNDDPEDEAAWRLNGQAIDDGDNWCVTFAEQDTS